MAKRPTEAVDALRAALEQFYIKRPRTEKAGDKEEFRFSRLPPALQQALDHKARSQDDVGLLHLKELAAALEEFYEGQAKHGQKLDAHPNHAAYEELAEKLHHFFYNHDDDGVRCSYRNYPLFEPIPRPSVLESGVAKTTPLETGNLQDEVDHARAQQLKSYRDLASKLQHFFDKQKNAD
eukprot:tig00000821_g4472.t1